MQKTPNATETSAQRAPLRPSSHTVTALPSRRLARRRRHLMNVSGCRGLGIACAGRGCTQEGRPEKEPGASSRARSLRGNPPRLGAPQTLKARERESGSGHRQ
ncbi:hypothetical protein GZL_07990 [Streptomyces sp. 769]|nr:hypothetical protein GZL_07990 [Streptomyces sp. 769]